MENTKEPNRCCRRGGQARCSEIRESCPKGDFATKLSAALGLSVANDLIGDMYLLGDKTKKNRIPAVDNRSELLGD
jgi:hypothetical protein